MMEFLSRCYYWFWYYVCGLPHPFTWYMRESANAHPLWWILTPIVVGVIFFSVMWFHSPNWWNNISERKRHFGFYFGSIALYSIYYVLVCHLWGIL